MLFSDFHLFCISFSRLDAFKNFTHFSGFDLTFYIFFQLLNSFGLFNNILFKLTLRCFSDNFFIFQRGK
jgi:hypothetical protein